jgi:hypothetical protein
MTRRQKEVQLHTVYGMRESGDIGMTRHATSFCSTSTAVKQTNTQEEVLHRDQATTLQTDGRNEGVQRKDKGRQSNEPHFERLDKTHAQRALKANDAEPKG